MDTIAPPSRSMKKVFWAYQFVLLISILGVGLYWLRYERNFRQLLFISHGYVPLIALSLWSIAFLLLFAATKTFPKFSYLLHLEQSTPTQPITLGGKVTFRITLFLLPLVYVAIPFYVSASEYAIQNRTPGALIKLKIRDITDGGGDFHALRFISFYEVPFDSFSAAKCDFLYRPETLIDVTALSAEGPLSTKIADVSQLPFMKRDFSQPQPK